VELAVHVEVLGVQLVVSVSEVVAAPVADVVIAANEESKFAFRLMGSPVIRSKAEGMFVPTLRPPAGLIPPA
jgi:hypothetical protein